MQVLGTPRPVHGCSKREYGGTQIGTYWAIGPLGERRSRVSKPPSGRTERAGPCHECSVAALPDAAAPALAGVSGASPPLPACCEVARAACGEVRCRSWPLFSSPIGTIERDARLATDFDRRAECTPVRVQTSVIRVWGRSWK